eukprot:13683888-Ditylum_brightwellii.AAC.1
MSGRPGGGTGGGWIFGSGIGVNPWLNISVNVCKASIWALPMPGKGAARCGCSIASMRSRAARAAASAED